MNRPNSSTTPKFVKTAFARQLRSRLGSLVGRILESLML
jgi:hypothetical protein